MTACAGLVAALGVRLAGLRVGFAAGVLFAALPTTARFAHEAGPEALALCAALAATLILTSVVGEPRVATYVGYAVATGLLGLMSVAALLGVVLAHGVIVIAVRVPARRFGAWLIATVCGALPVVPFAVVWFREFDRLVAVGTGELSFTAARSMPGLLFGGALLAGAVLALAFVGMSMRRPVVVATLWLFVTVVAVAVASAFTPVWEPAYLLPAVPAVAVLAAVALRQFTLARGLAVMLAVGLLGIGGQLDVRGPAGHGDATRGVGNVLRAQARTGDAAVYGPAGGVDQRTARLAVARYTGRASRPTDALARVGPGRSGTDDIAECTGAEVAACLGEPARVWVVRTGAHPDPLAGLDPAKQEILRGRYAPGGAWHPAGFTLALYVRTAA
jgi:mannosyltransferase